MRLFFGSDRFAFRVLVLKISGSLSFELGKFGRIKFNMFTFEVIYICGVVFDFEPKSGSVGCFGFLMMLSYAVVTCFVVK